VTEEQLVASPYAAMGEADRQAFEIQPTEGKEQALVQLYVNEKMVPGKIAVQLRAMFTLATMDDTHEIYYYKDGVYHRNAEAMLAKTIQEAYDKLGLDEEPSKHSISEVLGHLERGTYVSRSLFDSNPRTLNLRNGLFDLETLEFHPHDPKVLSLIQLPIEYAKDADCPQFKQFLKEVAYPEDLPAIQELFGYCLWKDYLIHKATAFIGDGSNGKSTLLNVLKTLLGNENCSSRSLQDLETKRFAASDLYGKMVNIYADLSDAALRHTGTFKMLTGKDTITAEFKFKNSFTFTNYAKVIFSCNKLPRADDDTVAFWRRWILFTFPNSFQGVKEDKTKLAALTTPEELSGILNWAVEGLVRLYTQNWTFSYSKSTEEIRMEYVRKSDPIGAFVMDCLAQKPETQIPKPELYGAFRRYCLGAKLPVTSQDAFFKRLPEYCQYTEQRIQLAGKRTRLFVGIQLLPDAQWGKEQEDAGPSGDGQSTL
jgi:putative DNA primase/helicase